MNKVRVVETYPSVMDYIKLREKAGLSFRSEEGVKKGLPNSWYGIHIRDDEKAIGMGRIIADGNVKYLYQKYGFNEVEPVSVGMDFKLDNNI